MADVLMMNLTGVGSNGFGRRTFRVDGGNWGLLFSEVGVADCRILATVPSDA
jgi:hypothetical protein